MEGLWIGSKMGMFAEESYLTWLYHGGHRSPKNNFSREALPKTRTRQPAALTYKGHLANSTRSAVQRKVWRAEPEDEDVDIYETGGSQYRLTPKYPSTWNSTTQEGDPNFWSNTGLRLHTVPSLATSPVSEQNSHELAIRLNKTPSLDRCSYW